MSIELAFTIFFFGCLVILGVFLFAIWYDKRKLIGECGCKHKCGYCKELEASEKNYSEECKHPNVITEVLESSATCETTVEKCADC